VSAHRDPDPDRDPGLDEVARLLDRVAAQEALEREEADALRSAPGLDRVEETLRGAWTASDGSARGRAKLRWWGVLAAAAVIVLFILFRGGTEPVDEGPNRGPRGQYLNDGEFQVVDPPERATRWDRIEWTGPAEASYRLRVRDAETGKVIHGPVGREGATMLLLSPEDTVRWPKRIVIEIEMRRADGSWALAEPRESELAP
jgi:hypothetical protein